MAAERGETALADVSRRKAEQVETEEFGLSSPNFAIPAVYLCSIYV